MKKIFTILTSLFLGVAFLLPQQAQAQVPEGISYQAILRDLNGNVIQSRLVGMQISVLQGSPTGTAVYVETQAPTTNANGLISLEIGSGTVQTGSFASIDWANGPHFIKAETDPIGGTNYSLTGTSQLLSVPYALHAKTAQTLASPIIDNDTLNEIQSLSLNNDTLSLNKANSVSLRQYRQEFSVSLVGDTLYISNGNWVIIPGISLANLPLASLTALECDSALHSGLLTSGDSAVGVSSMVTYLGGNGGKYDGQIIHSTGVTGLTATLNAGILSLGTDALDLTISGIPNSSGTASFAIDLGGQNCVLTRTVNLPIGSITALRCDSAVLSGTITEAFPANAVSGSVPYAGGNGGTYGLQTVASTGVTGLTANLSAGIFASGSGQVQFTITGTANSSGTALFALNIGGQSCTLSYSVAPSPYAGGSVFCATGPTAVVDVTNPTTGRTWMDRNIGATQVASSSADANSYGDLYQWGRASDGHQCRNSSTTSTLSTVDQPGHADFITAPNTPFDWRSSKNDNLWQGINGVNNPCPTGYRLPSEAELNTERLSWSSNNAAGAFGSPLKLPAAGNRNFGSGIISNAGTHGFYSSSSVNTSIHSRGLNFDGTTADLFDSRRAIGRSVRCIKHEIDLLDCTGATHTGTLSSGIAASGTTSSVPYTGGTGGAYNSQTVSSTGVTGLTATLNAGIFANGSGTVLYTISGTANGSGTASFELSLGGQTCTLTRTVEDPYPAGSVFCTAGPTAIVDVTNPATGKTWMDRNLGATQTATSSSDANAYGDLYQWGRGSDGHQCRNSSTTSTLSAIDQPGNANFILAPTTPFDWRSSKNDNLWQGVGGVNNPCPSGYRLPTEVELNAERLSWSSNNAAGAFGSPLKLPAAGNRNFGSGIIGSVDTHGFYSSSSVNTSIHSRGLNFDQVISDLFDSRRAIGRSVRCIQD
jgi:hypothetical protein